MNETDVEAWSIIITAAGTCITILGVLAVAFYIAWKHYNKEAHKDTAWTLLVQDIRRYSEQSERLQVQLAGCLMAAEGHTKDPAKPDDYGWSPAYQKVLDLRLSYDRLNKRMAEMVKRHGG